MTRRFLARLALALVAAATPLAAQEVVLDRWRADPALVFDAGEIMLSDLDYTARALVVFAESPNQPQYQEQLRLIAAGTAELALRDVIVLVDSDPRSGSDARDTLRPRGFSLVLVDKDGTVVFRKPDPWDVREISRQIDKLPSRIDELRR